MSNQQNDELVESKREAEEERGAEEEEKTIHLNVDEINVPVIVYEPELKKYGRRGLIILFHDLVERYFSERYYDPDLVEQILEDKNN